MQDVIRRQVRRGVADLKVAGQSSEKTASGSFFSSCFAGTCDIVRPMRHAIPCLIIFFNQHHQEEVFMALNLLELVTKELSGENTGKIASLLGETNSTVNKGIAPAIATVLSGLMNKASSESGAQEILSGIDNGGFDAKYVSRFGELLSGGKNTDELLKTGSELVGDLFGTRLGSIAKVLSSSSGLAKNSSTSLMGIITPLLMGLLGKQVSTDALGSVELTNLLNSQKGFVQSAAPNGLAEALGILNLSQLGGSPPASLSSGSPGSGKSFVTGLWPFIVAAFAFMLLMKACGDFGNLSVPPKPEPAVTEPAAPAPVAPPAPVDTTAATDSLGLGAFSEFALPNGVKLNIPESGIERKLIAFIEDKTKAVDKETWFSFDRLTFDTGKATLQPSSQEQLNNIAEILKAYPVVELKVGGYTDNVGDPKANLKLSQARAETVMAEVVKLGIDQKRLAAEGYGDQHPVADNATEEGRQKNRRVDCRVSKK